MFNTKPVPVVGKPIHYNTNGTGRDIYIYSNQGGFVQTSASTNQPNQRDKTDHQKMRHGRTHGHAALPGQLSYNGKVTHYQNNGSGRDSYISTDNGGQTAATGANKNSSQIYFKNLRNYPKIQLKGSQNTNFLNGINSNTDRSVSSTSQALKQKLLNQTQTFLNKKLSQPKWLKLENRHNVESNYQLNTCGSVRSLKNYSSVNNTEQQKSNQNININSNRSLQIKKHDPRRSRTNATNSSFVAQQQQKQQQQQQQKMYNSVVIKNSSKQQELEQQNAQQQQEQQQIQVRSNQSLDSLGKQGKRSSGNLRKILVTRTGSQNHTQNSFINSPSTRMNTVGETQSSKNTNGNSNNLILVQQTQQDKQPQRYRMAQKGSANGKMNLTQRLFQDRFRSHAVNSTSQI